MLSHTICVVVGRLWLAQHRCQLKKSQENVKGMMSPRHRPVAQKILKTLQNHGYKTWSAILDTRKHGVAHSRSRFYIVAILQDSLRHEFSFPEEISIKRPAMSILSHNPLIDKRNRLPEHPQARQLVKTAYNKVLASGMDPRRVPVIVDIACSKGYATHGISCMPCMTAARASRFNYWCSVVGRRILLPELMQLQGISKGDTAELMENIVDKGW